MILASPNIEISPKSETENVVVKIPLVSVCMIACNVEAFIAKAIESVLMQKTDFPFELVIGEDCSTDGTLAICEAYAKKYPAKIRLLQAPKNLGLSLNAFRTLTACRGNYIAMCDSDDYWSDPLKLKTQVEFLESNPGYGLVYSDVELISRNGKVISDESFAHVKSKYDGGELFFKLLKGNFIPNCTTLFRSELLAIPDYWERNWYAYDHWLWMNIAMRSKVHFMNAKTAHYRKHAGGVTSSASHRNEKRNYYVLHQVVLNFDRQYSKPLSSQEKKFIFRKMLSLLYRKYGSYSMKFQILKRLPKYYPGFRGVIDNLFSKSKTLHCT